jgi:BASS family bile acid:Na+ symporter
VFSLGLRRARCALSLPAAVPSSDPLAVNIIMPLVAIGLSRALALNPAVEIALVALSLSPVPPLLPKKQLKAGGHASYAVGLLVALSILSIVIIPVSIAILDRFFAFEARVPAAAILKIVGTGILVPLAVGMLVRRITGGAAERAAGPLNKIATIVLLLAVLPILVKSWPAVQSLFGNGTLTATAIFVVVGILVGHLLGGPASEDRGTLALATASRHPAIANTIAALTFPQEKLVIAAIVCYLIVSAVVSGVYLALRKKQRKVVAVA